MSIATKAAGELLVLAGEAGAGRFVPKELALGAEKLLAGTSHNLLDLVAARAKTVPVGPLAGESLELAGAKFPRTLARGADLRFQLAVDGEKRLVDVHLPPMFNPERKTPVYFLADGAQYRTPVGEMLDGYHWAHTANRNGFAAIGLIQSPNSALPLTSRFLKMAPNNSTWRTAHGFINPSQTVNDVNYFDGVLNGVSKAMNMERANIVGFCDGGVFAHELARKYPFNGVATVASTAFKNIAEGPLRTNKGFFATIEDDVIIPQLGGPGRSFGRFLTKMGHNNILESQPLLQGQIYAEANGLKAGALVNAEAFTQRTWLMPTTGEARVVELSLKSGGHNWPGTVYDHAALSVARQTAPERARLFNQQIVDFFQVSKLPGS